MRPYRHELTGGRIFDSVQPMKQPPPIDKFIGQLIAKLQRPLDRKREHMAALIDVRDEIPRPDRRRLISELASEICTGR
jgi:hypothetical protein